ncbi:MAG: hypothetical protein GC160_16975 [Acidobacteria bacterium]|nr:hypothetical protein [Acidobacteriota bacterium]
MSEQEEQHNPSEELVNVFSSSSFDAESEADVVHALLQSAGFDSMIVRQNAPELPTGVVEVRVFASQAQDALAFIESSTVDTTDDEEADEDE